MVKVTDCGCCDCNCDNAQLRETIKKRALSSINKIYTFDNKTYWPDGAGMVTIPLPTQEQLDKIESVAELSDKVDKNTAGLNTANELIAGEQTQIDSLKTTLETSYQAIVQKGSANGYAGLDNNARVPLAQLYAGTSANQVPLIGKQLLANEMLVVDADGLTVRSKPIVQTLSFRGIYPSKAALPLEGNVSGDYAIVSDGTAQDDTGYYVWGYNTATSEYEWVWTILFDATNYQLISNLVTEISADSDDSHYPSAKAVKDYHDASIGTVEQEITDINTDLATVQTTLGEHTTGIANAITQAQEAQATADGCYNGVSIMDHTLTFQTAEGETVSVELPVRKSTLFALGDVVTLDYAGSTRGATAQLYRALTTYDIVNGNYVLYATPGGVSGSGQYMSKADNATFNVDHVQTILDRCLANTELLEVPFTASCVLRLQASTDTSNYCLTYGNYCIPFTLTYDGSRFVYNDITVNSQYVIINYLGYTFDSINCQIVINKIKYN